jgi:RNA polymerase sigma-70 factor (ECF subfamily)
LKGAVYINLIDVKVAENMNSKNTFEVNNNFFEKYNSMIRGIVTNILKPDQSQDIDDCVNDVFLSLMEKLQQYNETRGSMAAFVIIIARSTALNYRKSSIRKTSELIGDEKIDFINDNLNFENEVEYKMLIKNILGKLNEKENLLFTMKFILFDSADEIAKTFSINKNAVEVRINRLKKKIKKLLIKGGIIL